MRGGFAWLLAVLGLIFTGCEEVPPTLDFVPEEEVPAVDTADTTSPTDTTNSTLLAQLRNVLVEEFTGVRCVNCPEGAAAIAQQRARHGARLVPVSLHTGFFSTPYPGESNVDFTRGAADAIEVLVGEPQGYPSAVINRRRFDGEAALQVIRRNWAGYIAQELERPPQVAIALATTLDTATRSLAVEVDLLGRETAAARETYLTVLLLEDDVVDVQLTPQGKDFDYAHAHVLREALTPPTGLSVGALAPGDTAAESLTLDVPADYDLARLEVVAFAHYRGAGADGKEVLQAVGVGVE